MTLRGAGLAAMATGLTAVVAIAGWLHPLDRSIGDALLRLCHGNPSDVPLTAIVIDDSSIADHGPLPWPRSLVGEVISAAHGVGASAVVLDLLLVEAGEVVDDSKLESALGEGRSLVAAALSHDGVWLLPHPRFGGVDRAAHVHAEIGPDGVVRGIVATKQAQGVALPALSLAAARMLNPEIEVQPGKILRPDFRPAPESVVRVSAAEFLASEHRDRLVSGRVVFVGVTATGSGDRLIVPTSPGPASSPGVLVHASAAASILRDGLIRKLNPGWGLFWLYLTALVPQVLRTRTGAFRPWTTVVIVVAVVVFAVTAMELSHLLLPVAALVVGVVLSSALREGFESRIARRDSGLLLQSLLRHHDPDLGSQVPTSSLARLAALRDLQSAVLSQDTARRTLLDGMRDGVVMWNSDGETVVINPAARSLWGDEPDRHDFDALEVGGNDSRSVSFHRNDREIIVSVFSIGDGGMALLRDVTAEVELERKRRDMQRLVSHELKTPLASIAGFGETLQRYELTREEQHRVASLIRVESERLGEMVATFLDLERLGTDQYWGSTEAINLGALVEERLEILSQAARTRGQEIVSTIAAGVLTQASKVLLDRVVDNLVGNALKYSPKGGAIEVDVRRDDGTAILTVTDHGVGIPEHALPHLFERFYRVPGAEGSGSGLGLAVVDEVVTWHDGCIDVVSSTGQGSQFTVRLPAEE